MQIEPEQDSMESHVSKLDFIQLEALLSCTINEIISRFYVMDDLFKGEIFTMIMKMYSKIFSFISELRGKTKTKYTPFRSNLLTINQTLKSLENNQEEKQIVGQFLNQYFNKCNCHDLCYSRANFEKCLTIYKDYKSIDKKVKFEKIGTLLKDMKTVSHGAKQVFDYNIAGVSVCKEF